MCENQKQNLMILFFPLTISTDDKQVSHWTADSSSSGRCSLTQQVARPQGVSEKSQGGNVLDPVRPQKKQEWGRGGEMHSEPHPRHSMTKFER